MNNFNEQGNGFLDMMPANMMLIIWNTRILFIQTVANRIQILYLMRLNDALFIRNVWWSRFLQLIICRKYMMRWNWPVTCLSIMVSVKVRTICRIWHSFLHRMNYMIFGNSIILSGIMSKVRLHWVVVKCQIWPVIFYVIL